VARARGFIASCLTAAVALAIVYLIFVAGLQRGFDHVLPFGPESEENAMTIALSDTRCHLNAGYVGYSLVKLELVKYLDPNGPNDEKIIGNLANKDLLNTAIRAAASVPCPAADYGHIDDGTLISMVYDDIGFVNYVKLAFQIFGTNIQSFYYLYFALLVASVLIFVLEFGGSLMGSTLLIATMLSFLLEANSAIFTRDMPSFFGLRHGAVLAIVPMWHFAFLLILRRRLTFLTGALVLPQLALLLFAFSIRGATHWALLFLCVVVLVLALRDWWSEPRRSRELGKLAIALLRWPLVAVLAAVFVYGAYVGPTLNPIYSTDAAMPYHGLWHSAYLGFVNARDSEAIGGPKPGGPLDTEGLMADVAYSKSHHFLTLYSDSFVSSWTHLWKFRLDDMVMRRVVTHIWFTHPLESLDLYARWKPIGVLDLYELLIGSLPNFLLLSGIATLFFFWVVQIAILRLDGKTSARDTAVLSIWCIAASIISAAPEIWAYPVSYAAADFFLLTSTMLLVACLAITTTICSRALAKWAS
jgi:hypothetical protein